MYIDDVDGKKALGAEAVGYRVLSNELKNQMSQKKMSPLLRLARNAKLHKQQFEVTVAVYAEKCNAAG